MVGLSATIMAPINYADDDDYDDDQNSILSNKKLNENR